MSAVQRWSHEHPTECVQVRYEHGDWVRYEDHAAALGVARLDGFNEGCRATEANYVKGRADALREAVAAAVPWLPHSLDCNVRQYEGVCDCECAPVLAAICELLYDPKPTRVRAITEARLWDISVDTRPGLHPGTGVTRQSDPTTRHEPHCRSLIMLPTHPPQYQRCDCGADR